MVALLEATMWRQIRDPEFLLGALKTYRMMTGLSQMDPDFAKDWWTDRPAGVRRDPALPDRGRARPPARRHRPHGRTTTSYIAARRGAGRRGAAERLLDPARRSAPTTRCCSDPAATALPDWIPANFAGPNGAKVFTRRSGKTLRVGIDGVFTYAGFHDVVLARLEDVAAQAALDRSVFAGGCPESAEVSVAALAEDMLKLYYEDFIAQWDGFLRDMTLAPLTDLAIASENLKDLSSADSALKRLLTAVVAETDLARPEDAGAAADGGAAEGRLQDPRQARQARQARQEGREVHPRRRRRRRSTPPASRSPTTSSRSRRAIAEVDGAPPALDAAVVALTALSNVLQTVAGQPQPRGGDQGPGRPRRADRRGRQPGRDPARPARRLAAPASPATPPASPSEAVVDASSTPSGGPTCCPSARRRSPAATPSTRRAPSTSTPPTSPGVFGPGGLIDAFTNDHLLPYVDTAARPWRWRADLGLDDGALAALERPAASATRSSPAAPAR